MIVRALLGVVAFVGLGVVESRAAIVVFGDSLSDNGNLFQATGGTSGPFFSPSAGSYFPTPPFSGGRASNGLVWVEKLAEKLGQPTPQPGFVNPLAGTNIAIIGSTTGPGSTSPFGAPNMYQQRDKYLIANSPTPDDLFVVWGGANDFLGGQLNPAVPVAQISQIIQSLIGAGGTEFLIPNLPLLGETPFQINTPNRLPLDGLSTTFNGLLAAELTSLRTSFPAVTIHALDVAALFAAATANPGAFGLTNVTQSAVSFNPLTGVPLFPTQVVANPDEYLYWDFVHPTRVAHEFLGEAAYRTVTPVPEPTSFIACLILVAAGIVVHRRRLPMHPRQP